MLKETRNIGVMDYNKVFQEDESTFQGKGEIRGNAV